MKLVISLLLLTLSVASSGKTIKAKTNPELQTALTNAAPGDLIIMQDGNWKDLRVDWLQHGTAAQPIMLKAQTPGKVVISGESYLHLGGSYLVVSGLFFTEGYAGRAAVLDFKSGKSAANDCVITQCVIRNFNNPLRMQENSWVAFSGKRNRLDHCSFFDKKNMGTLLVVNLDAEESRENFHQIDHNYFGFRRPLASNGGEIMRLGLAQHCQYNSNTSITENIFDNCDGETEIISIKSGANLVAGNVFRECQGSVVLRHGDNNVVAENLFLGNGKSSTGGIRVINKGQWVVSNKLVQCTGTDFRSPLAVMNGVPNSPPTRYVQVSDAVIANNEFIECSPISLGEGSDKERSLAPQNVVFLNNRFVSNNDSLLYLAWDRLDGIRFTGNVASESYTQPLPAGFAQASDVKQLDSYRATVPDSIQLLAEKKLGRRISASLQDPEAMSKRQAGANWFRPYRTEPPVVLKTVNCANGVQLSAAIAAGKPVKLHLTGTVYEIKAPLKIRSAVEITGRRQPAVKFISAPMDAAISLAAGGSLKLSGITIDGSALQATNFIVTDSAGSSETTTLKISNCTLSGFNTENIFFANRHTLADSVVLEFSVLQNNRSNILTMNNEREDKGYYNAEHVIVKRNFFEAQGGTIVNLYRGGVDESTLGPDFEFTGNSMDKPVQTKLPLIDLTGVQRSYIAENFLAGLDDATPMIIYKDSVRAKHILKRNLVPGKILKNQYVNEVETLRQ